MAFKDWWNTTFRDGLADLIEVYPMKRKKPRLRWVAKADGEPVAYGPMSGHRTYKGAESAARANIKLKVGTKAVYDPQTKRAPKPTGPAPITKI